MKNTEIGSERVFVNRSVGYALAAVKSATYAVRSSDSGRIWRIAGPQLHVDAADAAEAVSYIGASAPRVAFAYGSQAVDVTTNGGRVWFQAFLGEAVVAVVPGTNGGIVAYAQTGPSNKITTWEYVTRDGGRIWHRSARLDP